MRQLFICLILCVFWASSLNSKLAAGEPLPPPKGKTILSISGNISITNNNGVADFDLAMLKALGVTKIKTSTTWTEGVSIFQGVLLKDVLNRVGATGKTLTATALNDYAVSFPADDGWKWPVILAFDRDGKALSVRDKGPLWIVYPKDDYAPLQSVHYNERWIWQLKAIEIR